MSAVRNALIVGGGIGGLSTAIGLGRIGVGADVVEIQKQWAIYGIGIIQPGNAIRAYKALGLAERFAACFEVGLRTITGLTSWSVVEDREVEGAQALGV